VKEFNNRFAILVFMEQMSECNLDIEITPSLQNPPARTVSIQAYTSFSDL